MSGLVCVLRRWALGAVDTFVPRSISSQGADALWKARMLVAMSSIGIVALLVAGFALKGLVSATSIAAPIAAVAMAGVPLALRWSDSVRWPATMLTGLVFLFVAGLGLAAGPKAVTTIMSMVLVPVVATLLTGSKEGTRWTLTTCAVIAVLIVLGHAGVTFPLAPQGAIAWQRVLPIVLLVVSTVGLLSLTAERFRERGLEQLRAAHAELESTNAAIADREAQMRAVLDTAAEGILTVNDRGGVSSFNRAASRIFGYLPEEILGCPASILLGPSEDSQQPNLWSPRPALADTDGGAIVPEIQGLRKDGTMFPMALSLSTVQTGGGPVMSAIVRDLTEERALQSQLMQAQKLESVGQLAAGVAHEINTPTQFVGDNLGFLDESIGEMSALVSRYRTVVAASREGTVSSKDFEELEQAEDAADLGYLEKEIPRAISQAREGVDRVARIVSAMKEFSHPGSDDKQLVDLNRAIESTITVSRNEWKYVAEMDLDLDAELPPVPCFGAPINQVVLNLVVNAAHALGDRDGEKMGRITVRTRCVGEFAVIEVCDDGSGIPEAIRTRIFDPFFTTKEVGRGTGQGLAIAREVVLKHGGDIVVESEVGLGSTFRITLPLQDREEPGRPSHEPTSLH